MPTYKIEYDKESCSRCGGSGHYSRCQMYGTTCFKCGGRKVTLTRAAAKAAAAVAEFLKDNFSTAVENLKPGDRFRVDGSRVTVKAVLTGEEAGHAYIVDGQRIPGITVEFVKPVRGFLGPISSMGYGQGATVVRAVGGAEWDRVIAFARTIKRGITIVAVEEVVR